MNVLVTGSNGFIGHGVASYLKNKGHHIIGLGRSEFPHSDKAVDRYVRCDLASDAVRDLPRMIQVGVDAVIHLAADMRKEPHCVEVISANCCGTQRLLEMCEENGIRVFLQLSSLPVIGHPVQHPITEDHPINPYTVYHITKRTEELLADYACQYHGMRTASFRISAPVGPRVNPQTIFPTFVRKAMYNETINLLGKGTRRQNYLYVLDIARCLELSLTADKVHGVYNLTSDLLLSNLELAEMCVSVLGSNSKLEFAGEDPADTYIWDASIDRIRNDSGYDPKTRMEDVILEYADFVKGNS